MLQNATPLKKSAPGPPNSSDEHVSCTAPATENASLQILFKCPTPAIVFGNATKPWCFARFWEGAQSLAPATRNDIWTSKSGPDLVFLTFWLRNVLRATTACTFSTSQLLNVLQGWGALYILTWKCASRQWRAIFHLSFGQLAASLLFDPPEPQIIGKTQCFATFLPFRAPPSSIFWDFLFLIFFVLLFSSLTLPISAFHLSILSEVWLLNFLRIYIYIYVCVLYVIKWNILSYHIISYNIN